MTFQANQPGQNAANFTFMLGVLDNIKFAFGGNSSWTLVRRSVVAFDLTKAGRRFSLYNPARK
ncbi:hypothetical protein [Caballeronia sp. 15711]|uniref:hypothetical protein n=1 Tax=unclassified Caballeronia TaxID=2646786 RepID=UPI0039E30786